MASRLDQALDQVIKDRRSERSNDNNSGGRRRNNNNNNNNNRNNNRDRNDIPRRRQLDNDGFIRKRLGPSDTIKSFVRTVNVQKNDNRGSRNVNSAWAHDMFDDESSGAGSSILSRLGGRGSNEPARNKGSYISVENLHYDVTEKDISELFSTVADVLQAKLVFDISGRSTGVATIKYASMEDAEKAIKKYNNVELDGQAMRIELKEYVPRTPKATGGRFNNNRLDSRRNDRGDRGDRGDRKGDRNRGDRNRDDNRNGNSRDNNKKNDRSKQNMTAEDLDKEMDNYMNSTNNEDTDMMLD
ncbi:hypothetical protein EDC94DRAFT_686160 [Helicostylum pulchrum]|nr:hypothetical protein EDC94DRAFT_686160 [Helicostylum pulchrum]